MSFADAQRLKQLEERVRELEARVAALEAKKTLRLKPNG